MDIKKRLFDDFKQHNLQKVVGNRCQLFNFMLKYNSILKMIHPEDQKKIIQIYKDHFRTSNYLIGGCIVVSMLLDHFLRPQQFKGFKVSFAILKYAVVPSILFTLTKKFFVLDHQLAILNFTDKYNFNLSHFQQCFRVFERADKVGRLGDLLSEGDRFNWDGIPQLNEKKLWTQ